MSENKECWKRHRTIIGKSKMGLCPDCVNKYGTGALVGSFALAMAGKPIKKYGGKALKAGFEIIKKVK